MGFICLQAVSLQSAAPLASPRLPSEATKHQQQWPVAGLGPFCTITVHNLSACPEVATPLHKLIQ